VAGLTFAVRRSIRLTLLLAVGVLAAALPTLLGEPKPSTLLCAASPHWSSLA
jgi:hypothetical protein